MPIAGGTVTEQVTSRWRAIDPLLPAPGTLPPGCGAELAAAEGGAPAATGACTHWAAEPGSLEATWGAARQYQLTAHAGGPDPGRGLDRLLAKWRNHLAALPGAGEEDTAAVVLWPSRDVDGAAVLLRHGLAPWAMIAARVTGAAGHGPAAPPVPPGITIRRAGPADLESVVRLGMETVRYDARFGGVIERPWTAQALRRDAAGLLAGPPAWAWLAERDGEAAGLLIAERPPEARWIAPMAGLAPVAYLLLAGVVHGQRARGIGAALTARLHEEVRAAGVPVTLLHHVPVNPLSTPFWAQQGYRPLWISWEARPAAAIR